MCRYRYILVIIMHDELADTATLPKTSNNKVAKMNQKNLRLLWIEHKAFR